MTNQVAETILEQLGGAGKLKAMINAKNFSGSDNSLTFRFSMNTKMNCVKIVLNAMDTYDLTFYKIKKFDFPVIEELTDVYADNLISAIEDTTGLCLSLGTMKRKA